MNYDWNLIRALQRCNCELCNPKTEEQEDRKMFEIERKNDERRDYDE